MGNNAEKLDVQNLDTVSAETKPSLLQFGPVALSYVRFALKLALQSRWLGIKIDLDVAAENMPSREEGRK